MNNVLVMSTLHSQNDIKAMIHRIVSVSVAETIEKMTFNQVQNMIKAPFFEAEAMQIKAA